MGDAFEPQVIPLCNAQDLVTSGEAVPFDVVYCGQTCLAFAIRYDAKVYATSTAAPMCLWKWTTSPLAFSI